MVSQFTITLILTGATSIFAIGFIYFVRKEIEKMNSRKYKKLKGTELLKEQLR